MGAPAAGAASAAARGASPADLTAAAGGAAPARSAPRIELDPLELDPESGTATPTGFDPLAPRALLLWRVVEGRSAVMARGASARDGALEFPRVIVPRDGIEVVVSPEGLDPAALDASLPRSVEPGRPAAPHGEIVASAPGRWSLRVRASEAVGEILIAGVDGEIFARQALPPQPTPGRRTFDLRIEVPATDPHLWLAHALPDGRRSEWRRAAPFPAAAPEAP
ncbi:MAG TPA: hypothetical protein VFC77_10285 [Myxococcota bacterium]|nr:hypothetical protein [Myxococcota bacterium]